MNDSAISDDTVLIPPVKYPPYGNVWRSMQRQELWWELQTFVGERKLGRAWFRGIGVRLAPRSICLPDVSYMSKKRRTDAWCYNGMDLAAEFFGANELEWFHMLTMRTQRYAQAGVPEFWLVDNAHRRITVLLLNERTGKYDVHGKFEEGQKAASVVLKGFEADVFDVLDAGETKRKERWAKQEAEAEATKKAPL